MFIFLRALNHLFNKYLSTYSDKYTLDPADMPVSKLH